MKFIIIVFFFLSCQKSQIIDSENYWNIYEDTIIIDNIKRDFLIYKPTTFVNNRSYPLLLVLHGGGGSSKKMFIKTAKFSEYAKQEGVILVYPNGINNHWNDGRNSINNPGSDDIKYIKTIIDTVSDKYSIDRDEIFVCGHSNGGFMSARIGIELQNIVRSIAGVSSTLDSALCSTFTLNSNVNALFIHGSRDNIIPLNGGIIKNIGTIASHKDIVERWSQEINSISFNETEYIDYIKDNNYYIISNKYKNPTNNYVVSYIIENMEHEWPGSTADNIKEFDACLLIWNIFFNDK